MTYANIRVVVSKVPDEATADALAEELRQRFEYVFVELVGDRYPEPIEAPDVPSGGPA